MNQLDLLHALEEIAELLTVASYAANSGQQESLGRALHLAHSKARAACEATYADLNAEAAEMEAAFNEAVKPPKIKSAPRDARELGSMEDVLSYLHHR